mgnify:CR=1 FL=1
MEQRAEEGREVKYAQPHSMQCCGGVMDGEEGAHAEDCPSYVWSALSWIEETPQGDRMRLKGLAAFGVILARRDRAEASLAEALALLASPSPVRSERY